ncbi:MAG TPA: UvrD-helicase domain-containing protein [Ignavibacteriales bacterium]|nr:UvrD-helicase domain-containing protein [Ignavibacteriales bacterium]
MPNLTPHQNAALNIDNHISLTANAGSGKTFVLSKRYVAIALKENISLRNIAAITFTEKAAGELNKKIAAEVALRLSECEDGKERAKLERIRRELVSANISTIHSFCIDILKELPFEAGIDANFIPADENHSGDLIDISVQEIVEEGLKDPAAEAEMKKLIRVFSSKNFFAKELKGLIGNKRKSMLSVTSSLYSKSEDEISRFFFDEFSRVINELSWKDYFKVQHFIGRINDAVLADKPDNSIALNILELSSDLIANRNNIIEGFAKLVQLRETLLTRDCTVKKKGYLSDRDSFANEIKEIENFFATLEYFDIPVNHAEIELELARFGKLLCKYFQIALDRYTAKKQSEGILDFEDILLYTRAALKNENAIKMLRDKFHYIMVDEYQDTNEIQYEIFMPILNDLKQGNLFVVGDEKQSIYMFRDAELEIFQRTKTKISAASGNDYILNLPESFRMAPEICHFTNSVFSKLFSKSNPYFNEVEYNELICAKDETERGQIELILADCENQGMTEAELIARRILQMQSEFIKSSEGEFNFSEIAILCRKRKHFDALESAFVKYAIPFRIVGGRGFYQRQIIYDVYNYISFLINQDNDAALAGILRSPFFSFSDTDLFEIGTRQGDGFWGKLIEYSKSKPKAGEAVNTLRTNLALASKLELSELLRRIMEESGYLAVAASKTNGEQEIANIEKLLQIASDFQGQGFRTLYDFAERLKTAISSPGDEGQAALSGEGNSVKIMTIHQAKGLEYDSVFLYQCGEASSTDPIKEKSVTIDKDFGILAKVPLNENYFAKYEASPIIGLSDYIYSKKNSAEIKRLFYVAATRAKKHLVMTASHNEKYTFGKNSFMSFFQEALDANLSGESVAINSDMKFLIANDSGYGYKTKTLRNVINIIRAIELIVSLEAPKEKDDTAKKIKLQTIPDTEENEIFSATKIAVFSQCPLKYQFTYELGYSKLFRRITEYSHARYYEFNSSEDREDSIPADVKGKLIHKFLQEEIDPTELPGWIAGEIKKGVDFAAAFGENTDQIAGSIQNDLAEYFNSAIYKQIRNYKNYINECEVYLKEKDYFLFGIIDKLVLDNDEAIIIDYKTNSIKENEIEAKAAAYSNQMQFYAALISRLYPDVKKITTRLIFTKYPGKVIEHKPGKEELAEYLDEISLIVQKIRRKEFLADPSHCGDCVYSYFGTKCAKANSLGKE